MMIERSRCTRLPSTLLLIMLSASPLFATDFIEANYTWTAPVEGSPAAFYVVQHSVNGGPFNFTAEVPAETCRVSLELGNDHQIRVAGVDDLERQGPWSLSSDVYCPEVLDDMPPEYEHGYTGGLDIANGNMVLGGEAYLDSIRVVECSPGGSLGGDVHLFVAALFWDADGSGDCEGFKRRIIIPLSGEIHTAARAMADSVESFATGVFRLTGRLDGDTDFDELVFTAGSDYGLSSPGFTTLTLLDDGTYSIDSHINLNYNVAYASNDSSTLEGLSGVSEGIELYVATEPSGLTDVEKNPTPELVTLAQNAPNPFNPRTVIRYELPAEDRQVGLGVFDIRGRRMRVLVDEPQPRGSKSVSWDGTDDAGRQVAAGVYFCRLTTSQGTLIRKMTLVK